MKLTRRTARYLLLSITLASVGLPLVFLFYSVLQVRNIGSQGVSLEGPWTLYVNGATHGTAVVQPKDLREYHQKGTITELKLTKEVDFNTLRSFKEPVLLMGRVGDIDQVTVDGHEIGSTGRFFPDGRWVRSDYRAYPVPISLFDGPQPKVVEIKIQKIGTEGVGMYEGPISFVEQGQIEKWVKAVKFFETYFMAALGFLLVAVGLYYGFVYVVGSPKIFHLYFSITAIALGFFDVAVSRLPYRITSNVVPILKINAFSAIVAGSFFVWFLRERLLLFPKIVLWIYSFLAFAIGVASLFPGTMDGVRDVYAAWMPLFIIMVLWAPVALYSRSSRKESALYGIGLCLLPLSLLNDVGNVFGLIHSSYALPYAFSFVVVAIALQLAEETAYAYQKVEQQVVERTNELASALDQLRSLEKMKERFFANISHDFKTPIAVALGSIDEVKRKGKDGAGSMAGLAPAERSLNQLLGMVQDLLDTVKAESGTLKVKWERARPGDLLKEWISPYQVLCRAKNISLELVADGYEGLLVPLDVFKTHRVFENLLSNAVKFTDRRAGTVNRIRVGLRTDDARMYVEISDSGIGVPPEERETIFDRYYQSSRTLLKEHGGSGIGLSFAKEMVELQHGKIWVEESEFGGSKFIVSLPLSQDVEVTGEYHIEREEVKEVLRGSLDVAYPPERPKHEAEGRERILVAEDNPEVAQITYSVLADEFNVHFASNGEKALQRLQDESFDGLVTDIVMPAMRGDELVRELRKNPKHRDLPIVVLSSHGDEETITTVLKDGANDYVTKPFRGEILLARVKSQIHSHKTSQWIAKNEKVIELGFLAGGMAHQIRNGLNSLSNQVSYQQKVATSLLEEIKSLPVGESEKLKRKLEESSQIIRRALDRIEQLTDSVRTYSTGSKQRVAMSLADTVELAKTLHADELSARAVSVEFAGMEGLRFQGYASFHEAIVNLLGNAIGACPDDGTGKITMIGRDLGQELEISIQDNGTGIAPEVLPKLCQPFFTTKPPGEGTGLGLYIVRDVVEGQHGGTLTIKSEGIGKGATFTVRIPKEAPLAARDAQVSLHGVQVS